MGQRRQNQGRQLGAVAGAAENHRGHADRARPLRPSGVTLRRIPAANWTAPDFDANAWQEGLASFATAGTPGAVSEHGMAHRRHLAAPRIHSAARNFPNLQFYSAHDEDVEIYVNGILASSEPGFTTSYVALWTSARAALALLKPGATVSWAVHCHQTTGGQNIDVGLVDVEEAKP